MLDFFSNLVSIFASNKAATAATFAAAITGAFAALKFYGDKAAKVTDFRKAWVETLRQAVSEFSGSTHTIAGRIVIRIAHRASDEDSELEQPAKSRPWSSLLALVGVNKKSDEPFDKALETELMAQWSTLRLSYNKVVLHLNPNEHSAYITAEETVAKISGSKVVQVKNVLCSAAESEVTVQPNTVEFLYWCVNLASDRAQELLDYAALPWWEQIYLWGKKKAQGNHSTPIPLKHALKGVEDAQKSINKECVDAGSCLLLSAFATKRLLYGKYEKVAPRIAEIEKGIRVVDTSAALVIKGVWEKIKKGEPLYRIISFLAILISLVIMSLILIALYANPVSPDPGLRPLIRAVLDTKLIG